MDKLAATHPGFFRIPGGNLLEGATVDTIEYAIGDTSTMWGAGRAADGPPAPFDLHYVETGHEDWFDSSAAARGASRACTR
jgi:hypothetical protein